MLGFFALVGLSIKNTILLTDYANQGRRAGLGRVDAIVGAVEERFRPLLATSVTAIFSLLPLALISPFWESLAYTLIFGLISSTILVLLVFPYYYLGAEYLRMRIGRRMFFSWVAVNVLALLLANVIWSEKAIAPTFLILNLVITILKIIKHKTRH
jgi:predicted RND superfamily exporter protein